MNPGLAYPASRSEPPSTPKAKFVDDTAHRLASGGLGARIQASVQARGPLPGKSDAAILRLFGRVPAGVAIDPLASAPSAGARSEVPAARLGRLASGGATPTPLPEGQEEHPKSPTTKRRWNLKAGIVRMLRHGLKRDERGPAVCGCGSVGYAVEEVTVHRGGSGEKPRAWVSGVYRCGSGWLCPTCAPAVAAARAARVQRVVESTAKRGGHFVMGLVTVSHDRTDSLADVKALVTESFAAARNGSPWDRIRIRGGVRGVLVAPEVTHGTHGWHFHIHFGMACLVESKAAAAAAGEDLIQRFMRAVEKRGGKALRDGQGVAVAASPEAAVEYISKGTAWELAAGTSGHKDRVAGRTQWDIAEDAIAGDETSFALWREYAEVMPGTRSCVVSPGLAAALGIEPHDDDEAPGEQVLPEEARVVGTVSAPTWTRILHLGLAGTFLGRIESDVQQDGAGFDAALAATVVEADAVSLRIEIATARRRDAERQASAEADRLMAVRRVASAVRSSTGAGTRDRIRRAILADAAANPGVASPTAAEILRELASRH